MEATDEAKAEEANKPTNIIQSNGYPPMVPGFFPAYVPIHFPLWPPSAAAPLEEEKSVDTPHHQVLKPIPVVANFVNVDELVGMSQLSLAERERRHNEPSPLSLKWLGEPSRQSAFQTNAQVSGSDLSEGKTSAIQAL